MAAVVARTMLRSATRSVAARVATGVKPAMATPFRMPAQKPLSARNFRSPVEMGCVSLESMFPLHSATASALLTSMLAVSPRTYGWTLEGQDNTS